MTALPRSPLERLTAIAFVAGLFLLLSVSGFLPASSRHWTRIANGEQCIIANRAFVPHSPVLLHSTTLDDPQGDATTTTTDKKEKRKYRRCMWKPKHDKSRWQQRLNLKDLEVGQKLSGHVVESLVEGHRTGPKLYFECGVGRTNSVGEWSIVNAMLRLPRGKLSVAKKRAARYRKRDAVDLYVSRVQTGCGRLEVCATEEEAEQFKTVEKKVPVTSLKPQQEVRGTIVKVLPYGAMVDVGANRLGLLHIKKVADLFGKYIDKEQGMKEAGIERKAKVRLMVESIEKRRLALDFTPDVKQDAQEERQRKEERKKKKAAAKEEAKSVDTATAAAATTTVAAAAAATSSTSQSDAGPQMSEEELAQWAAYASQGDSTASQTSTTTTSTSSGGSSQSDYAQYYEDDEDDDDDDDDYDEDRDIEDAFGLGFY